MPIEPFILHWAGQSEMPGSHDRCCMPTRRGSSTAGSVRIGAGHRFDREYWHRLKIQPRPISPQKNSTGARRKTLSRHVYTDRTNQADRTGRSDDAAMAVIRVNAAVPTTTEPIAASAICQNPDGMR